MISREEQIPTLIRSLLVKREGGSQKGEEKRDISIFHEEKVFISLRGKANRGEKKGKRKKKLKTTSNKKSHLFRQR